MKIIWKYFTKMVMVIWNGFSYFLGVPYEEQAKKLDSGKFDPILRGPENEKTNHTAHRANKVSN